MSVDREAETLVPCPACEDCAFCGGDGEVDCFTCVLSHTMSCTACKECGLCKGKRLVAIDTRAAWFRHPNPPESA